MLGQYVGNCAGRSDGDDSDFPAIGERDASSMAVLQFCAEKVRLSEVVRHAMELHALSKQSLRAFTDEPELIQAQRVLAIAVLALRNSRDALARHRGEHGC